jgi:hypothetical protein
MKSAEKLPSIEEMREMWRKIHGATDAELSEMMRKNTAICRKAARRLPKSNS